MQRLINAVAATALLLGITGSPQFLCAQQTQQAASPAASGGEIRPDRKRALQNPIVVVKEGRLTLEVANVRLESVLERLSEGTGIAIISAAGLERVRVSLKLQDIPLEEGLREILKDQDCFYFYSSDRDSPARLKAAWVYPKGRGRGFQPVPPEQWASTRELEGRTGDPDPDVRWRALTTLIERNRNRAVDLVQRTLKEEKNEQVRMRVLDTAIEKRIDLPAGLLANLLCCDESENIRFLALQALSEDPNAAEILKSALKDPNPHIRRTAGQMMERLEKRSY